MKITQLREKDGNLTLSTTDLDTFLQKIKTETKTQPVSTFRQQLRYCLPGKRCNEADRLPKVLPAARIPQDERCLPDENLQRHRGTDRRPAFRQVRNSPCETSCLGTAPDAARIHRFQRTDCKDLDYLHPSEQFAAGQTGRSRSIPRPCLPPCREMLPAPTAFRNSAERAQAGTVLPPLLRPRSHVPPGLHTVLSCTAPSPCPTKPPIRKPCKTRSHP